MGPGVWAAVCQVVGGEGWVAGSGWEGRVVSGSWS